MQEKALRDFAQLVTAQTRTNAYVSHQISTVAARAQPRQLGISANPYIYRWAYFEASDIAYNLRFDKPGNDPIVVPANRILWFLNHDFLEIYIDHVGGGAITFGITCGYNTNFPVTKSD